MAHFAVFEKHYRNLEQALPANAMLSTFISKGLLRDITLLQRVACENTDCGKTRLLLESMRGGLKIGETKTFEKFLEALCEYADRNNDLVVKKLVEDVYKDWRFPENLKRQRYAGDRITPTNIAEILRQQGPSKWLRITVFVIAVGVVLFCFLQAEDANKPETDITDDIDTDNYHKQETNITNMLFLVIMFAISMSVILVIIVGNFI
ncbi:uncharacterized protein [Dysidea avara]|uniref:uncharacterized protein n=1 Tax=Dysidea avara TaxID=196820 RepID=UPI0033311693